MHQDIVDTLLAFLAQDGCSDAEFDALALGADLPQAVAQARDYVRGALAAGAQVRTGAGSGPLNHAYAPQAMHLKPLR